MRRAIVSALVLVGLAAGLAAQPAAATPPGPVADLHVTTGITADRMLYGLVSWTYTDAGAAGALVCIRPGRTPETDAASCQDGVYVDEPESSTPLRAGAFYNGVARSISVWAFQDSDTGVREYSDPVVHVLRGSSVAIDSLCRGYGRRCTITGTLVDPDSGRPIAGQVMQLWTGGYNGTPKTSHDPATTNTDGLAVTRFRQRAPFSAEWRYSGGGRHVPFLSPLLRAEMSYRLDVHLTTTTPQVGDKIKVWGRVAPPTDGLVIRLWRERRDLSTGCLGSELLDRQDARVRDLPNGNRAYGYVFSTTVLAGRSRYYASTTHEGRHMLPTYSKRLALTTSTATSAAIGAWSRAAPMLPAC